MSESDMQDMREEAYAVSRCPNRESGGAQCEKDKGHEGPCACPSALKQFLSPRMSPTPENYFPKVTLDEVRRDASSVLGFAKERGSVDVVDAEGKVALTVVVHQNALPDEDESQLDEALDFIEAQEWARWDSSLGRCCLDCGAPKGYDHSTHCRWLSIMRRGGRRE